jgi:hypothetical protein
MAFESNDRLRPLSLGDDARVFVRVMRLACVEGRYEEGSQRVWRAELYPRLDDEQGSGFGGDPVMILKGHGEPPYRLGDTFLLRRVRA